MYTEDYENRGFPFRDFLLKLILIIIFVFLLVWLLPKFIKPTTIVEKQETTTEISAIASQIFNDNLNAMKDAAISYYTDERLPKEIGEYDQMTLGDMIGKKIITPLIDKNNKAVDVEASYVKITKADDEYILKVNIKDSEKEDYILVHLGCYTYCNSYVCEKEETNVAIKGAKPSKNQINKQPEENKEEPTKPSDEPEKPADKEDDKPAEPTPEDKPQEKPEEDKPDEPVVTPSKKYQYEYKKTTNLQLSAWTPWSSWEKASCSTKEVNCNDNSASCLYKLQTYKQKQKIATYTKKQAELTQVSSYSTTTCSKYNYVVINSTTYTTTTTYNVVNTITSSTASTVGDWKYIGRYSYDNPPRDTSTTHYEFVGADFSYCEETCESLPKFFYDKYTYTGKLTSVPNTTSTPESSSTSSSTSGSVSATCGSYVTNTVPVYGYVTVNNTDYLYGTVCYKSTKTRKLVDPGKTQYKWSSYNDTNLLNNGWSYTGQKKLVD